jgi:ubiquinone/menaquinone biosynthesis C-methylase UbiE
MAYALYTPHDTGSAHRDLWTDRSVAGELQVLEGRTLVDEFHARLPVHARILEAGCGLGGWVRLLQDVGHDISGIDFEPSTVARVNQDDPTLDVKVGDVTALSYPDDSFDVYISLGVVEHFEDGPDRALAEAYRVIKPGGLAFVTVPFENSFRRFFTHPLRDVYFAIQARRGRADPRFWEYRYTAGEMIGFLESAGFEIIKIDTDDYKPELTDRHIGLHADFFFLRKAGEGGYALNSAGRLLRRALRQFPRATSSGVLVVAAKPS